MPKEEVLLKSNLAVIFLFHIIRFGVIGGIFFYFLFSADSLTESIVFLLLSSFVLFVFIRSSIPDFRYRNLLVINNEGITDYSYGLGFIPWENIKSVKKETLRRLFPYNILELELFDEDEFFNNNPSRLKRLIKKGRSSGRTGFWINTWKLNAPREEIITQLLKFNSKLTS